MGRTACHVISYKFRLALAHCHPVAGLHGGGVAGAFLLLLHLRIKSGMVECHAVFFEYQLRKVEGESVSIVEHEGFVARNLGFALGFGCGDGIVEQTDTVFKCAKE